MRTFVGGEISGVCHDALSTLFCYDCDGDIVKFYYGVVNFTNKNFRDKGSDKDCVITLVKGCTKAADLIYSLMTQIIQTD